MTKAKRTSKGKETAKAKEIHREKETQRKAQFCVSLSRNPHSTIPVKRGLGAVVAGVEGCCCPSSISNSPSPGTSVLLTAACSPAHAATATL